MTGTPDIKPEPDLNAAYNACQAHVRELDPDRYIACLFAPAKFQPHLFALYAFNAEISRIRELVSEPMLGEIRQQWWREALSGSADEKNHSNPIAMAALDTMQRFHLPAEALLALIEARSFDLYNDPMPTWGDLEGYCGETSSALLRLASLILADGEDPGSAALCGEAGVAYALTGLVRSFALHAHRKQCYLPSEVLIACNVPLDAIYNGIESDGLLAALSAMRQRARHHLARLHAEIESIDTRIAAAFYPVYLCDAYLNRMDRADYRPYESQINLSPLMKFWQVGKGAWRTRR